jgi:predicted amidohydrolase
LRAAAVQLNSGADRKANVAAAERLVREAAADGAELIVGPEKFTGIGTPDQIRAVAEPLDGPTVAWARALAAELGVWLVPGSITERAAGTQRLHNTSILCGPDGELHATYRKIHMFDVEVGGKSYRESEVQAPGDEIVVVNAGDLPIGMATCYDLRFPELFRILALRGALAFALPAAFTVPTGEAHWQTLVRARAIENQAFVIAAGQVGEHSGGHASYGHSMIVDAWGNVLAEAGDGAGACVITADLDLAEQAKVREQLPSLENRRPDTYIWPSAATTGALA